MTPDIPADVDGLAALATLLLLPGLLVVRAPWTAVPFLSSGFWIVSWWWLPHVAGRQRFLRAALLSFLLLALLRLLKPVEAGRPSGPALLVFVAALARLLPFALWPVAPGADMSLHSLSTQLLVWRDGIPSSYEPLLPIHAFGAYTPGLHCLAADVSLLSGLAAYRSTLLVSAAAYGLLQLALFALLSRLFAPATASLAAVLSLGMARVPQAFFAWGGNPSTLALAFLVAAAALLVRGAGRSPAVAAGAFLGAAVVSHSMVAAASVVCFPLVLDLLRRGPPAERLRVLDRLATSAGVGLLAAAPFLVRLDFTLAAGERAWLADHLRWHYAADWGRYSPVYPLALLRYVVSSLNDAFLAAAFLGTLMAVRRRATSLAAAGGAAALLVGLAGTARWGGAGPLVFFPERPMALLAIVLSVGLAFLVDGLLERARGVSRPWALLAPLGLLALGGVAIERANRYYLDVGENVMVSAGDLEAMAWIASHTRPVDLICNDYRTAGLWIPALAGRPISEPQLPPFYFDEFRRASRGRVCSHTYVSERWFFGPPEPQGFSGRVLFQNASVSILEGGRPRDWTFPRPGDRVP